ncbi:hypothetical protein [Magnetospirillum sp. 64-120]|uniref:hypothetical protein n=1 Tax=Magnetospirillum sp. 64-120 TaxID=1895778 RepID=UPI0025C1A68F|nr:hypothetical protein [Magnetospirillum sp. 64-120]
MSQNFALSGRNVLETAIRETACLFANPMYRDAIEGKPFFTKEWFGRFLVDWKVARSIDKDRQTMAYDFLRNELTSIHGKIDPDKISDIAVALKNKCISARCGSNGPQRVLPLSLTSKVAYFFFPLTMCPYDKYAFNSLKKRMRHHEDRPRYHDYVSYVNSFNLLFSSVEGEIAAATRLECSRSSYPLPDALTGNVAVHRKILDQMLVIEGR